MTSHPGHLARRASLPLLLSLALAACGGGGDSRSAADARDVAAGPVDTGALRSGVPHPRPQPAPRGTPIPDSLLRQPDDTLAAPMPPEPPEADEDETPPITPVTPAPGRADDLRVMPWSLLTPIGTSLLRQLAARQEERFASDGTYGDAGIAGREGWSLRVLFADENGWAAEATQTFHAGKSCVIWGGDAGDRAPATRQDGRRGGAGRPVCDGGE